MVHKNSLYEMAKSGLFEDNTNYRNLIPFIAAIVLLQIQIYIIQFRAQISKERTIMSPSVRCLLLLGLLALDRVACLLNLEQEISDLIDYQMKQRHVSYVDLASKCVELPPEICQKNSLTSAVLNDREIKKGLQDSSVSRSSSLVSVTPFNTPNKERTYRICRKTEKTCSSVPPRNQKHKTSNIGSRKNNVSNLGFNVSSPFHPVKKLTPENKMMV